ncbi:S-layer homology domain-containing protein [Lysinibacillus sp. NPDC048646]
MQRYLHENWAKDMIEDIAARGIITGYPDCTFRPKFQNFIECFRMWV